ncbi:SAV_2336 N-terminal domain-related protein [Streptomyces sp. NPDC004327]|uniref:SAV_2336 N-terminal domain-related protein n=1 Tax=Streptomyces sp. NPDC004327 TaxID=3364699 RepID=UPI0036811024
MIERLAGLLRSLGDGDPPPSAREVAELLWLAGALSPDGTAGEPAEETAADPGALAARAAGDDRARPGPVPPGPAPEPTRVFLPDAGAQDAPDPVRPAGQADAPTERAAPVRVAGPATLPRRRELARALRPLKRTVPSTVRTELDEDATASRIADHHHWLPVLVPADERRLDVSLVVDAYDAGAVFWEPLARELRALLGRLGAFRSVRLHHLLPRPDGTAGLGRLRRPPASAVDPTGRTLTLVLTDGVAPGWRTATLLGPLRDWATRGPTAILQTLPERVWDQTALPPRPGRFRTAESGAPNTRMTFESYAVDATPPTGAFVAVPILGITPEWLAPWARAVARPDAFDGAAVLLPAAGPLPTEAGPSPERRAGFEEFLARAHPDVFRLAAYLAAAPLNLAVMRTVQSALLPHSPPSDLAEIVYSGLLHRVGPGRPADGPLDRAYDFAPGVRERLLATLRRDEADDVLAAVSTYVDHHAPALGARFTAAIADPDGPLALPVGARHWAEVHRLVRRRQGRGAAVPAAPVREGRRLLITCGGGGRAGDAFPMTEEAFAAFGYELGTAEEAGPEDCVVVYHADDHDVTELVGVLTTLLEGGPAHVLLLVDAPHPWPVGELPLQPLLDLAGPRTNVWAVTTPAQSHPRLFALFARAVAGVLEALEAGPGRRYVGIDTFLAHLREACGRLDPPEMVIVGRNAGLAATPPFFPNPFYAPRLAEGAPPITNTPALAAVSSWLHERTHGVCLLVGSPGSGKSTVLDSLLTLTDPDCPDRDILPASTLPPTDLRYLTLEQAEGRALAHDTVLVVDDAADLDLLRSMESRFHVMIVAAIDPITDYRDAFGDGPVTVVDLDSPAHRLPMDVYARCLAAGLATDPDLAEEIGATLAAHSGRSHVMARLLAQRLRARYVSLVPQSVAPTESDLTWALDTFVRRLGAAEEEWRAVNLLTTLAYVEGEGAPGTVWAAMTKGLVGERYTEGDVRRLVDRLDGWITVSRGPDDEHYRLPHPAFVTALRASRDQEEDQGRIARALWELVPPRTGGEGRDWAAAPWYVRAHAFTHATRGGVADEFLDADVLLGADPSQLAPALREGGVDGTVALAYLDVAPLLEQAFGSTRRDLLAFAVLRHGENGLAEELARGRGWRPLWAVADRGVTAVGAGATADGWRVVLGDRDGTYEVREAATGRMVRRFRSEGPVDRVTCVAAERDQCVVVARHDGQVRVLTLGDGIPRVASSPSPPWSLVAGADVDGAPHLVVAAEGRPLVLWDLLDGRNRLGHPFRPASRPVALATTRINGRVHTVTAVGPDLEVRPLEGDGVMLRRHHSSKVLALACTPDGMTVTGTEHGIHVWVPDHDEPRLSLGPPLPVVHVAAASLGGRLVVVGAMADDMIRVWGLTLATAPPHTFRLPGPVEAMSLTDRILTVVVGGDLYVIELLE